MCTNWLLHRGKSPIVLIALLGLHTAPAAATVYQIANDGNVQTCGPDASGTVRCAEAEQAPLLADAAPDVPPMAITTIAEPDIPADFRKPLLNASSQYEVSPRLLAALTGQESAWRASARSPKGAVGLTQLMPATARALAVDPRDPEANLAGGARYLRQLIDRFDGNLERALAAYNAGPARVDRAKGIPAIPETRAYVASIVSRLSAATDQERK